MGFPQSLCILTLFTIVRALSGKSGIYYDSGTDQTIVEPLTIEDQDKMMKEILDLLGMKQRPRKSSPHFMGYMGDKNTVNLFMWDIFKSLTLDDRGILKAQLQESDWDHLRQNAFHITDSNINAIIESDMIMSFANHGEQEDLKWNMLYWFNSEDLPDPANDELLTAELRIYKENVTSPDGSPTFQIKLMQPTDQLEDSDTPQILAIQDVPYEDQGWLVLDVTKAVKSWQYDYKTNQGLVLNIVDANGDPVLPKDAGLNTTRHTESDKESFLATYFKATIDHVKRQYRMRRALMEMQDELIEAEEGDVDEAIDESPLLQRQKRGSGGHRKRKNKNRNKYSDLQDDFSNAGSYGYHDYYGGMRRHRDCDKRMLRVSFRDLNWQDWIIAPDAYNAYFCQGECSFPLNSHMNATNHAIVQTLVHLMSPDVVPKPCCAPIQLSGISVLYLDESSNVVLKKYSDMVVKTCGCH